VAIRIGRRTWPVSIHTYRLRLRSPRSILAVPAWVRAGRKIKTFLVLCDDDNTSLIYIFIFRKLPIRFPETAYFCGGFYRLLSPSMRGLRQRRFDLKRSDAYAQKRARKRTTRKVQ